MSRVLNTFDKIAPYYGTLTRFVFGRAILKSQLLFLNEISIGDEVLVLGGGSGDWIHKVQKENSGCEITYVEASAKMLALAKNNVYDTGRIKFVHGTHVDLPKTEKYDVIIAFFFFDMFDSNTLNLIIGLLKERGKENCIWLVSDFVKRKKWHSIMLKTMYCFFRVVATLKTSSLPDWQTLLKDNSLNCEKEKYFYSGFICSSTYRL